MKKITQVLYSGITGTGTVAFNLFDIFKYKDLKNYFIFYGIEPVSNIYLKKIISNTSIYYYEIRKQTKTGFKEWYKYYKNLKSIKTDIILLHSIQLIIPSFLYKLFNKTKIISIEHDSIAIRTKKKWIITNLNAILADNVIILNKPYKEAIYNHLWFKRLIKKYIIIPNGIDTNKYSAKKNYFTQKTYKIFMASRINRLRDHQTLIKAVNQLVKKGYNIQLRIAGDGETLSELQKKFNNQKHITFLGNINEKEIIKELHKTDIYVHATFAETFSIAILQAMSCALPIITSNIEGVRHMIKHKYNGLLFENKNVLDLQEKILHLIKDKNFAIKLAKNARNDVEKYYDNKIITKKYLELFN